VPICTFCPCGSLIYCVVHVEDAKSSYFRSPIVWIVCWICTYQRWKSSLTKHPKWYNSDIRHHLNCIRVLRKRCISRPTIHNSSKLQLSETQFQHKMLAAKANFEAELILNSSPNNISRVYKCINSITRHDTIPQNVSLDSQMAISDIEKANLFNTFFYSVFTRVHSTYLVYPYLLQQFATSQYPSLMSKRHWLHWIQLRQWELMELVQKY